MLRRLGREVARACFVLALLAAGVAAWLGALLSQLLGGGERSRSFARAACKLAWTPALRLLPWVTLAETPEPAAWEAFFQDASAGAGALLVCNHVSGLDPLVLVALCPSRVMVGLPLRVLVHAAHFGLPLFGRVCAACGHFPVHLEPRGAAPGRRVNRALQASVMADVKRHVERGGVLVVYPEGRCAPRGGAATLGAFHAGAFGVALDAGAPVWAVLQVGTAAFAPPDAFAGGFPARIGVRLVQLRPRSAPHAAQPSPTELAEACRGAMQRQLDDMLAAETKAAAHPDATEPLLQRCSCSANAPDASSACIG